MQPWAQDLGFRVSLPRPLYSVLKTLLNAPTIPLVEHCAQEPSKVHFKTRERNKGSQALHRAALLVRCSGLSSWRTSREEMGTQRIYKKTCQWQE